MKFDQKQMHALSQLYMAASKAGHTFDLARLMRDQAYAGETLAKLSVAASQLNNEQLTGLTLAVMEVMSTVAPSSPPVASASPIAKPVAAAAASTADNQYIGKLR
jgi:hypothetical protein